MKLLPVPVFTVFYEENPDDHWCVDNCTGGPKMYMPRSVEDIPRIRPAEDPPTSGDFSEYALDGYRTGVEDAEFEGRE